jgi:hypothetical protein
MKHSITVWELDHCGRVGGEEDAYYSILRAKKPGRNYETGCNTDVRNRTGSSGRSFTAAG